jgi:hypothetical protein
MKAKYFLAAFFLTATFVSCNNNTSDESRNDSTAIDSSQSIYPEPDDVLGNDTVPSPEQSKNPTLQNK